MQYAGIGVYRYPKLILFYENLGETNNHIENYKKELFIQLDELKNPKVETTDEKQNQTEV